MNHSARKVPIPFAAVALALATACGSAARTTPATTPVSRPAGVGEAALADSVRNSYSPADVAFMTGMIHHHAQALVMSRMAPTHGASDVMLTLTARIINSQKDEIALMQRWLRDRGEPVPEPEGMDPSMHGGEPMMHMPGMLTDEQLARLDAARGPEFDLLFLTYMIQHHEGAVTMVNDLFGTQGAGQGEAVFKLASDIGSDQTIEIERMQIMLREMMIESTSSP